MTKARLENESLKGVESRGWRSSSGSFPFGFAHGQDDGKNLQQQPQEQKRLAAVHASNGGSCPGG
jgi:hypothetical protein